MKNTHTPISSYLPHDVIESILIRLQVKSLLRLQVVCKRWSATISDPIFGNSHLQQSKSKNSPCGANSFFVLADTTLRRAVLENDHLRELSPSQHYQHEPKGFSIWCYCDGLFLISYHTSYVVWNPSRRTHRKLVCPYDPVDNSAKPWPRVGIYYHSVAKDYRVVVVGVKHNAVYSCKNKSWSETKSNSSATSLASNNVMSSSLDCAGVSYKESIYWSVYRAQELGIKSQIVCFDGEDETLKIVCNDLDPRAVHKRLYTSRDSLYLMSMLCGGGMSITKVLPEWREHKAQLPIFYYMLPLSFTPHDKVIFMYDTTCLLYDHNPATATATGTGGETTTIQLSFNFTGVSSYDCFPCIETLFLL